MTIQGPENSGSSTKGPVRAPAIIVSARPSDGSLLRGAGQAVTAAMVTATIVGACVAQVRQADGDGERLDDETLDMSSRPPVARAVPAVDLGSMHDFGPQTPLEGEGALQPRAENPAPEHVSETIPCVGMEPIDPAAPRCVRVPAGADTIEVLLRA